MYISGGSGSIYSFICLVTACLVAIIITLRTQASQLRSSSILFFTSCFFAPRGGTQGEPSTHAPASPYCQPTPNPGTGARDWGPCARAQGPGPGPGSDLGRRPGPGWLGPGPGPVARLGQAGEPGRAGGPGRAWHPKWGAGSKFSRCPGRPRIWSGPDTKPVRTGPRPEGRLSRLESWFFHSGDSSIVFHRCFLLKSVLRKNPEEINKNLTFLDGLHRKLARCFQRKKHGLGLGFGSECFGLDWVRARPGSVAPRRLTRPKSVAPRG